jgi:hypothetical protein
MGKLLLIYCVWLVYAVNGKVDLSSISLTRWPILKFSIILAVLPRSAEWWTVVPDRGVIVVQRCDFVELREYYARLAVLASRS